MTKDEMRMAIAESVGKVERLSEEQFARARKEWESEPEHPHSSLTKPVRVKILTEADYPHDLNAMHEVEKTLNEKEQVWYLQKLTQVRYRKGESGMIACMIDRCAFATARQRAEAYLRTKGLWKE